jgi:hypothetical protein
MHRFQTWRDALQVAASQRSVTRVMREYARALPAELRSTLPDACQYALTDPIDVQEAAVTLVQAELACAGTGGETQVLHEVARTFAAAAVRFRGLPDITRPNAL